MAKSYLDSDGLLYLWQKIKNLFAVKGDSIKSITRSGTTFTATKADGTTFTFTQQDNDTWTPMTGATSSANGTVGYVNAVPPSDGYNTKYLRADGTWTVPPDTTYTPASTTPLMDGTGAVGTATKYAREDHVHPSDTTKVDKVNGKGLSTNDFTDAYKTKIDGIASGAEVNQNAFSNVKVGSTTIAADGKEDTLTLEAGSNVTLTPDASGDKVTIAATDTTYSDATTSASGLMSSTDKSKLDNIAAGAEVNQNAFANVKVGSTTIAADGKQDTLEFAAGSNVTLTPDASGDKVTIAATDTTYENATTSAAGLMSADDKSKLNNIASGAEVNQNAFTNVTVGSTTIAADSKTDTLTLVAGSNVTITPDATNDKVTIAATDTTYTAASATPGMDGTGAVGTSVKYAREDHVHPSDTSRVPTTRTVNGKALSSDISLSASDVSAIPTSAKGAASGVCPLNASSKIDSTYLPSYIDDVVEVYARTAGTPLAADWFSTTSATGSALTPEAGIIYVLVADSGSYAANSQFRWTGTAYVKLADGGVSSITNAEIDTIVAS